MVVEEDVHDGLSDSAEWKVYVPPYEYVTSGGEEKKSFIEANLWYIVATAIAIVILLVLLVLYIRKRRIIKKVEELQEVYQPEEVSKEEFERISSRKKKEEFEHLETKVKAPLPQGTMAKAALPKQPEMKNLPPSKAVEEKPTLPKPEEEKAPVLPEPEEEKIHGILPPPEEEKPSEEGEIDLEKAAEEGAYSELMAAIESKGDTGEVKVTGEGEVKPKEETKPSGPRTGRLKEGEEIKRDEEGWIVECVMRNKLPSVYVCPDEQMAECKLTCIQKMRKVRGE